MNGLSPLLTKPWPAPITDELTQHIVSGAIDQLAAGRSLSWLGDPATELHLYASLAEQIREHLAASIQLARETDPELDWTEIAHLAGITSAQARQLINDNLDEDDPAN